MTFTYLFVVGWLVCFWIAPGGSQGILLALYSEINSGRLMEFYGMPGISPILVMFEENALTAVLSL